MLNAIRQGWGLIEPGRRWRWVLLVGLAIAVGGLESFAALLVYALLGMVTAPGQPVDLPVLGDLRERFSGLDDVELFTRAAIVVAIFFVARSSAYLTQSYLQSRLANGTGVILSDRLLRGYLAMPYAFHLQRNSAELIRNAYGTVAETVMGVFVPAIVVASEAILVLAMATVLFITSPLVSAAAAMVLVPLVLTILRIVQPRIGALGRENQELSKQTLQLLQQTLEGVRDIKVLDRHRYFETSFAEVRYRHARTNWIRALLSDVPRIVLETVLILGILATLTISVRESGSAGETLALLGLFAYAALRLMPSLNKIVGNLNYIRYGHAGVQIIRDDLEELERGRGDEGPVEPMPFDRDVRLERVTFRYDGSTTDAITDAEITIVRGQSIGIVGPTGGGKTTMVDLFLGLLAPTSGRVLVDGVDIAGNLRGWQARLGIVPQTLFLVDDTLRRNIAFGRTDGEIDEEAVRRAVNLAQLDTFVRALPDGLDTVVGERGVRLSGGQRQRVAIARALYRDPEVIVFDEGTSALDSITEAEVVRALESLRADHTLVTVAHRLSTVQTCDRIVVVRDGRIADIGTYDELIERDADFRRMAGRSS